MLRIWVSGTVLVVAISTLETFLVVRFAMADTAVDPAQTFALIAIFFGLTATVAYVGVKMMNADLGLKQNRRLSPNAAQVVAKESIVLHYAPVWGLSKAEADVAIFVVNGFSNSEIASMRGCANSTVKSQLSKIYQKSGLDSRYQLISFITDEVCMMSNEAEG